MYFTIIKTTPATEEGVSSKLCVSSHAAGARRWERWGWGTRRPCPAGALALRCACPTVPSHASPVPRFLTRASLISHGFLLMFRHGSRERGALSMKSSLESWPCLKQTKVKENKIYFQGEAKTMFAVTSGIKWWCGPPHRGKILPSSFFY